MTFFSADRANEQYIASQQGQGRPDSLQQYASGDGQQIAQRPMSQINDRAQMQYPLIDKDGQQERQGPIYHVTNYDASGQPIGNSEYKYSSYQPSGAKLDGCVDRDAQGNITQFMVRKPALFADQKDVYMVFKSTPDNPINEDQMKHVFDLLRPDVPADQRMANQQQLNNERPLAANLQHNLGNQIVALRLDPQTGQRYEIRDMRVDPNTGNTIASGQHLMICWHAADGKLYRYPVANLPDREKQDISNATFHGNMREPLMFLQQPTMGQDRSDPQQGAPRRRPVYNGQPAPGPGYRQ